MLQCIHLVLANCETMENVEIVQRKINQSVWVVDVNKMCNIQSNSSTQKQTDVTSTKGDNSRHKLISSSASLEQVLSSDSVTRPVTQSEIEYYNMKSRDAALDGLPHSRPSGKNTESQDRIPQTIPESGKEQFQQFGTKLLHPDQLAQLSGQNIPRLVTHIKYNVFLKGDNGDSFRVDKLQLSTDSLLSADNSLLKDGQKPVMVQLLYIDTNEAGRTRTEHSSSPLTDTANGSVTILHNTSLICSLILTVIFVYHL